MVTLTVPCTLGLKEKIISLRSSEEEDIEDFHHIMSYQNQTVKNIMFVASLCIAMETNDYHICLLFFQVIKDLMVQNKSFFTWQRFKVQQFGATFRPNKKRHSILLITKLIQTPFLTCFDVNFLVSVCHLQK